MQMKQQEQYIAIELERGAQQQQQHDQKEPTPRHYGNNQYISIKDEDGNPNYPSGKPRTNSCFICRQYAKKENVLSGSAEIVGCRYAKLGVGMNRLV